MTVESFARLAEAHAARGGVSVACPFATFLQRLSRAVDVGADFCIELVGTGVCQPHCGDLWDYLGLQSSRHHSDCE
jgi:hypothetical protein